jgi:hypothetical protein
MRFAGMTRGDVFIKILAEVSGEPETVAADFLKFLRAMPPGIPRIDDELPADEAEELLTALRAEKEGIRAWLMDGYRHFLSKKAH